MEALRFDDSRRERQMLAKSAVAEFASDHDGVAGFGPGTFDERLWDAAFRGRSRRRTTPERDEFVSPPMMATLKRSAASLRPLNSPSASSSVEPEGRSDGEQSEERRPRHRGDVAEIDVHRLMADLPRRRFVESKMNPFEEHVDGRQQSSGRRFDERGVVPRRDLDARIGVQVACESRRYGGIQA